MIQKLYSLERKAKEEQYSSEQRGELRMSYAVPVLSEIGYTLEQIRKTSHPKSPLRIAAEYTLNRWESLLFYVQDGLLEIDNNWVENSIRPTALGRKNFLFAGSHVGARRAAIFYSLFGTCKKNNVNPYEWLSWVLSVINDYPAKKIDDLLPQNFKPIQTI